jgi:hypothetical protein
MRAPLAIACLFLTALAYTGAQAQTPPRRPQLPQLPIDPLGLNRVATAAASGRPTCDFNIFGDLTKETLKQYLDACAAKLATDSKAALDDATAINDTTAIACLKPGTAILEAAVPGKDAAGNPTEPGVILLFQKFRDFVMAGGPSACKSWVNTTIAGANPITN